MGQKKDLTETLSRIRELSGVEELNIQTKKPLDSGSYHAVYPMAKDPDKVIKIGHDGDSSDDDTKHVPIDPDHIKAFNANPDLFPIIYKTNGKWAILEKLNTTPVYEDNDEIVDSLRYDAGVNVSTDHGLAWLRNTRNKPEFPAIVKKLSPKAQEVIPRYLELFAKIDAFDKSHAWHPNRSLDFHIHQMGYTKDGKLKLLDF